MAGCLWAERGSLAFSHRLTLGSPSYTSGKVSKTVIEMNPSVLWEMSGKREVGRVREALERDTGRQNACPLFASQPAVQSGRWGYVWLLILPEPLYLQSLVRERNTAVEGKLARVHGCPSCNKGLSFHIEISNFIFREKEKQWNSSWDVND